MAIRIDALDPTVNPQRDHEAPAMRDGLTVKLSVAQILGLIQKGDLPADVLASLDLADGAIQDDPGAVANANLANMAQATVKGRAAGAGTGAPVDLTAAQLSAVLSTTGGYRLRKVTRFTSSGTWTPESWTRLAVMRVVGGGGGGGGAAAGIGTGSSAGSGGAAGGYVERWLTAGWGATETVTIGAAGTAGAAGGNGVAGGTTSVGTLAVAGGGGPGLSSTQTTSDVRGALGGTGGSASVAGGTSLLDTAIVGDHGGAGIIFGSSATAISGQGASSPFGNGGRLNTEGGGGNAGTGFGSGGSGGAADFSTARAGGAGTAGIVVIEEWE
jgi:hypothetical protein